MLTFRRFFISALLPLVLALSVFQAPAQPGSGAARNLNEERNAQVEEFNARQAAERKAFEANRQRRIDNFNARQAAERNAFEAGRQREIAAFNAKRDSARVAFMRANWPAFRRIPGVSLPATLDSVTIKTVDIPPVKEGEGPDIEIIDALLREGVSEAHAAKIALEIIDSLGIDALIGGQSVSIVTDPNNAVKPVAVSYNVNPSETTVLLQTQTDEYKIVEKKEALQESYQIYEGTVAADGDLRASVNNIANVSARLSNEIVAALCNLTANGALSGDRFRVLVRRQNAGEELVAENILSVIYTFGRTGAEKKAFWYHEGNGSPYNGFYTPNGVSIDTSKYLFPLRSSYRKTSGFGMRHHPILRKPILHNGTDYGAAPGTPVHAIAAGVVTNSGYTEVNGNYVSVRHEGGIESYYLHLRERGIVAGSRVAAGDRVGLVGNTGRSTGPHLHLGIKKNGAWQDPEKILGNMVVASQRLNDDQKRRFDRQVESIVRQFR